MDIVASNENHSQKISCSQFHGIPHFRLKLWGESDALLACAPGSVDIPKLIIIIRHGREPFAALSLGKFCRLLALFETAVSQV